MDNHQKQIDSLREEVERLKVRRMYQMDYTPQSIKNAAMGEANSYVFAGLEADLPTSGVEVTSSVSIYFCTDTHKLKIWDGTVWRSVTLA